MATLGSLNIGDCVYDPLTYSDYEKQGSSEGFKQPSSCMQWVIIGKNKDGNNTVTLMSQNGRPDSYYDQKEPNNPNTDIAQHGDSRYHYSNIFQYLNKDASSNWWVKSHTYDTVYNYNNEKPAFLYRFSDALKSKLISTDRRTYLPTIYGGGYTTSSGKVHMLSASEFFGVDKVQYDEGSQYEYFANHSIYANTRSTYYSNDVASAYQTTFVSSTYVEYSTRSYSLYGQECDNYRVDPVIIVLPSNTTVSTRKYRTYFNNEIGSTNPGYYALVNMPLAIEMDFGDEGTGWSGATYTRDYVGTRFICRVYDEKSTANELKICKDDVSNVVYRTTNIIEGQEYTYELDTPEWELNEQHTYYFIASNMNGDTVQYTRQVKRGNAIPRVEIDVKNDGFNTYERIGDCAKSPTVRFFVYDNDEEESEQDIYLYVTKYVGSLHPQYTPQLMGVLKSGNVADITVPIDFWKAYTRRSQYDTEDTMCFVVSSVEYTGEILYATRSASLYFKKITPAPYITVESTNVGRKNIGFTVKYTPHIDTDYTITKVEIYIDNILKDTVNSPVPDNELAYEITKAALYDMTLGNHTIGFKVYDDIGQNTITNVAFTRYNDAPNIIATQSLGNKNLGFSSEFSVSDTESDTMNVRVYVDDVTSTPIFSQDDVPTGSRFTYEVTKAKLYTLSLGQHTIKIVATDAYDSTTVNATFTRTNNAPVIVANQETSVHYEDFDVTYTVTDSEQDATNLVFKIGSSTIATVNDVPLGVEQTQTISISGLGYGSKILSITATDSQGKTSTKTLQFTIRSEPVITAPEIGKKSEPFTGTFKVDDPDGDSLYVKVTLDSDIGLLELNNAPHNQNITYVVTEQIFNELSLGQHSITIFLKDIDQNVVTKVLNFTVASMPVIEIDTPLPASITKPVSVNIRVSDEDGDMVTVKAYIDSTEIPVEEED